MLKILFMGLLFLGGRNLQAQSPSIPHLINFQSVLTDAGGVSLPDGQHKIQFRLLSASKEVLYQETQDLESVGGVVSAMVGQGGGEIPIASLAPGKANFLGVQVEGASPEILLEIVSVPYAMVAEQALQVASKSIGSEAIIPKSITADLLADNVLQELLAKIGPDSLPSTIVSQDELGGFSGASQIGVETNFVYSRGPSVQGVLKDLDTAIYQRQVNLNQQESELNTRMDTEVGLLKTADSKLQNNLDAEAITRLNADKDLQTQIGNVNQVNANINQLTTDLSQDVETLKNLPKIGAWANISVGPPPNFPVSIHSSYNVASASFRNDPDDPLNPFELIVNWATPFSNADSYVIQVTAKNFDNLNMGYEHQEAGSCGFKNTGQKAPPWNRLHILTVSNP